MISIFFPQQSGQFVLQQSPGGTQQLVNIVQTPQGVQAQRGQQIVIQTQAAPAVSQHQQQQQQPGPPQVQVTQTTVMPGTPNQHQIVIQKQGMGTPTGASSQQQHQQVPGPPQMQVQTKTVIVSNKQQPMLEERPTETMNDHHHHSTTNPEQIQVNGDVHIKQENSADVTIPVENGGSASSSATNSASQSPPTVPATNQTNAAPSQTIQMIPAMDPAKCVEEDVDPSWLWVCDWRGCPK